MKSTPHRLRVVLVRVCFKQRPFGCFAQWVCARIFHSAALRMSARACACSIDRFFLLRFRFSLETNE